jgi:hypothetical protein
VWVATHQKFTIFSNLSRLSHPTLPSIAVDWHIATESQMTEVGGGETDFCGIAVKVKCCQSSFSSQEFGGGKSLLCGSFQSRDGIRSQPFRKGWIIPHPRSFRVERR